jgi:hypothetical protein
LCEQRAVIHGSWVDSRLRPESDVDVLGVGDVDLDELRAKTRPIARRASRRIDLIEGNQRAAELLLLGCHVEVLSCNRALPTVAGMQPSKSRTTSRRGTAVAVLVIGGLVASIAVGVFLIGLPNGDLPGIALESAVILVIERISVLFAAWLLGLVVIVRALVGELPIEISGRGTRTS